MVVAKKEDLLRLLQYVDDFSQSNRYIDAERLKFNLQQVQWRVINNSLMKRYNITWGLAQGHSFIQRELKITFQTAPLSNTCVCEFPFVLCN